ncbi:MAG: DUF2752 domain-containing protein [Pirellulaceae bacterium]
MRIVVLVAGVTLLALLATAACLQPSPDGFGTHQQLGLPPCSLQLLVGMRCPACGMTTSWSHFMHGQWLKAVMANSGGALLALLSAVISPVLVTSSWKGHWIVRRVDERWVIGTVVLITMVILVDWGIRVRQDSGVSPRTGTAIPINERP